MAKALRTVGTIVGVAAGIALIATGVGAVAGTTLIAGSLTLAAAASAALVASALLTTGASLLAPKPRAPSTPPAATDRLQASINLRTPRTFVIGETAFATDVRDQEWATDQSYLDRFIVCASHKARAIREIWFDDKLAWSSAGGVAAPYAGYLTVNTVLEGSAANAIVTSSRMGSSRRYTGCAYIRLRYKLTGNSSKTDSPFAGGSIPTRMTIIGEGIPVPDPRANGFNPADQNTWSTDSSACRNPAMGMLAYLLGWRINGKLAVGKGIPPARLDLASFAVAANLCDEPVTRPNGTSEPRYRCDGIFSEGDETSLVLDNLKATMNAVLDDVDGKIRLSILFNDLATPIGDLTTADVLGEYTWDQTAPLSDSVNVIRGGYTDPSTASLFQMVDYPEVRIASTDGIDRVQTINLPLVQSAGQAQRLAKLRLARFQYGGTYTAVFQATAWKFQKGDVIRFTFYPLGWDKKLFRIADMTIQVDGTVPMMLREEHPDIYAAYSDEAAAVQGAAPTNYDPQLWPVIQGIIDVGAQIARAVSDGWLDPSEKRQAKIDYDQRTAQRDALQARYVALGSPATITTARDNAFARMQDLFNFMQGLSPSWLDYSVQTQVPDPAAYQAAWKASSDALEIFSAAITGQKGDPGRDGRDGLNGSDGTPGPAGADGRASYLHTAYANAADGSIGFTTGAPGSRKYLGVLVDFLPADSNTPTDYTWSLIKGADGLNGSDGTPGAPGANGLPTYVHIAYSNAADGSVDFSLDDPAGRSYVGFYVDQVLADSTDRTKYAWSLVKGAKGDPGENAPLVLVQWSIDGSSNWHFEYQTGDKFQRQSNNNGQSWGPAVRVVGESAQSGIDGISPSIVFIRSATVPATPSQDTGNPPPGWSDDPPLGTTFLWQSVSKFRGGMQLEAWSAPVRISGADGGSSFSLRNIGNTTVTPNTITKVSGGDGWNGKAATVESGSNVAVSGMLKRDTFIGLDASPTADNHYNSMSYALHRSSDPSAANGIGVFRNGERKFGLSEADAGVSDTTRFSVKTEHGAVRYYLDANLFYEHGVDAPSERLYGTFALAHVGDAITGITFAVNGADGLPGANAPLVKTQWSIDGVSNWHDNFFGADQYYRQSNDGGVNYGPPIRGVGEDGTVGADGSSPTNVFIRSATVPPRPNDHTGNPPPGWSDGPPAGTDFLWLIKSTYQAGVQITTWSAPQRISGEPGKDGKDGTNGTGINKPSVTAKPSANWAGTGWTLIATSPELTITGGSAVISASVKYGANSLPGVTGQLSATIALTGGAETQIGAVGAVGGRALPAGNGDPATNDNAFLDVSTGALAAGNYVIRLYARGDNTNTAYIDPPRSVLTARNN